MALAINKEFPRDFQKKFWISRGKFVLLSITRFSYNFAFP